MCMTIAYGADEIQQKLDPHYGGLCTHNVDLPTPRPTPRKVTKRASLAVLVDEDHAGGLERGADRRKAVRQRRPASNLEVGDGVARDDSSARQFSMIHVEEGAGGAAL